MFVPLWIIFLITGLIMAVLTIIWTVKTGQFEDQQRARYLPLVGLSPEELAQKPPIKKGVTYYSLLAIVIIGLSVGIGMTLLVIWRLPL